MLVKNNEICYKSQPLKTYNTIIIRKYLKYLIFNNHSLAFQNAMKPFILKKLENSNNII